MRFNQFVTAFVAFLIVNGGAALAWEEPSRGSKTRKQLMDALRPHAIWVLGGKVQFVVNDLRRDGNLAFASVDPQRPGGSPINLHQTPGAQRGELDPDFMDGPTMQALFQKSGETWVAVHWAIGATDVWYSWGPYCAVWHPVTPDVC